MQIKNTFFIILLLLTGLCEAYAGSTTKIPPEPLVPIVNSVAALKPGSWLFSFYQENGLTTSKSTANYCLNSDNTWNTAGPIIVPVKPVNGIVIIPGNGGWIQDGRNFTLFGTQGEAIIGAAYSAFGEIITENLITGHYVHFNVQSYNSNSVHGTYSAVYQGAVCPL